MTSALKIALALPFLLAVHLPTKTVAQSNTDEEQFFNAYNVACLGEFVDQKAGLFDKTMAVLQLEPQPGGAFHDKQRGMIFKLSEGDDEDCTGILIEGNYDDVSDQYFEYLASKHSERVRLFELPNDLEGVLGKIDLDHGSIAFGIESQSGGVSLFTFPWKG